MPLAVVLGGAAGNLIDRLRFGFVVDYVGIGPWPTFNLGDVAIPRGRRAHRVARPVARFHRASASTAGPEARMPDFVAGESEAV